MAIDRITWRKVNGATENPVVLAVERVMHGHAVRRPGIGGVGVCCHGPVEAACHVDANGDGCLIVNCVNWNWVFYYEGNSKLFIRPSDAVYQLESTIHHWTKTWINCIRDYQLRLLEDFNQYCETAHLRLSQLGTTAETAYARHYIWPTTGTIYSVNETQTYSVPRWWAIGYRSVWQGARLEGYRVGRMRGVMSREDGGWGGRLWCILSMCIDLRRRNVRYVLIHWVTSVTKAAVTQDILSLVKRAMLFKCNYIQWLITDDCYPTSLLHCYRSAYHA